MIHGTRTQLEEAGAALSEEDKQAIEAALTDLEEATKGDDKDAIDAKTQALIEASGKLMEAAQAAQASGAADAADAGAQEQSANADDDVVDAEFEEVKDDDKK